MAFASLPEIVVLFTADHGNMLGDRARFFKGVIYEGSTHVPLLWRGVRGAAENRGRVEPKIIENTDLAPALLEAAGLPVPAWAARSTSGQLISMPSPGRSVTGRWPSRSTSNMGQSRSAT
jgi:arylsulfatase A-like enzyme